MKVYIKARKRKKGQFQFYMQQFVESAIAGGFTPKGTIMFDVLFRINSIVATFSRLCSMSRSVKRKIGSPVMRQNGVGTFRKLALIPYPYFGKKKKKKAIIVTSRGEALFRNAFPFFYNYEIIPMLWDVWPHSWESLYRDLQFFECKIVFVTVKTMAEKISRDLGIQAYWVPEGIDPVGYGKGKGLCDRPIEVYELGRQKKDYHVVLEELYQKGVVKQYYRNIYNDDGGLQRLAFPTVKALLDGLQKIKIIVSFPQADTHPQEAGGLDTLTQRYWEAMLSRCLVIGRAPRELIELMGYDPVVNVDWQEPETQIEGILSNILDYQELVDRNYAIALEKAPWSSRIDKIIEILNCMGYVVYKKHKRLCTFWIK